MKRVIACLIAGCVLGVAGTASAAEPVQLRVASTVTITDEYSAAWKISYRCPVGQWIGLAGNVSQPDSQRAGGDFAYSGSAPIDLQCSGRWDTYTVYLFYPTGEATGLTPGTAQAGFRATSGESETSISREVRVK